MKHGNSRDSSRSAANAESVPESARCAREWHATLCRSGSWRLRDDFHYAAPTALAGMLPVLHRSLFPTERGLPTKPENAAAEVCIGCRVLKQDFRLTRQLSGVEGIVHEHEHIHVA